MGFSPHTIIILVTITANAAMFTVGPWITSGGSFDRYYNWLTEYWIFISIVPPVTTSIASMAVAIILKQQLDNQKKEQDLTLRPILSSQNVPEDLLQLKERRRIVIPIRNLGKITATNIRIMLLPLDQHRDFASRKQYLVDYLRELKSDGLRSTESSMVLRPARERMKDAPDPASPTNYIILGNDLEKIKPKIDNFKKIVDSIMDKKNRKSFEEANGARAHVLAMLGSSDWNSFYHVGKKRGDLIDTLGPADWEVLYKNNWDKARSTLVESASKKPHELFESVKHACDTRDERSKIISRMTQEMKDEYYKAAGKLSTIWKNLPDDAIRDYIQSNMDLRNAYREAKDIKSVVINSISPNHSTELTLDIDYDAIDHLKRGDFVYFGALIQYNRPGNNDMEYGYYIQGYLDLYDPHVDYAADISMNDIKSDP
ncbi:MAG: hypothetical protein MPJ06_03995 [Nitrosopumilus sp.]|nr:hypothetical protein [Nitrosopumilus sp.]